MDSLSRFFILVGLAAASQLFYVNKSHAFECAEVQPEPSHVFIGTVAEQEFATPFASPDVVALLYRVEVESVARGDVAAEAVVLTDGSELGGRDLLINGETYLFFANDSLAISDCQRSRQNPDPAAAAESYGPLRPPSPDGLTGIDFEFGLAAEPIRDPDIEPEEWRALRDAQSDRSEPQEGDRRTAWVRNVIVVVPISLVVILFMILGTISWMTPSKKPNESSPD